MRRRTRLTVQCLCSFFLLFLGLLVFIFDSLFFFIFYLERLHLCFTTEQYGRHASYDLTTHAHLNPPLAPAPDLRYRRTWGIVGSWSCFHTTAVPAFRCPSSRPCYLPFTMCILSSNTKSSLLSSVTRIPIRRSLASTSIRNQQSKKTFSLSHSLGVPGFGQNTLKGQKPKYLAVLASVLYTHAVHMIILCPHG